MHTVTRMLINSVGQLSSGIQLCTKEGLTSGMMLDYIYENKPRGRFGIGVFIDWLFIRHKGWEGTRLRKKSVERFMHDAIDSLSLSADHIHILDIASGPASYVLNILKQSPQDKISAHCQDIDDRWLSYAQEKAAQASLSNITFGVGDAFDFEKLATLNTSPNIILSSGFYDWIKDDEKVKASIKQSYKMLPANGSFITTNQVSHPNQEFVQAVFSDFNNTPLDMKMRSTATMKSWLEEAGFKVINESVDRFGYYSVLHAKKG